jgi:hypothetical protein
VGTTVIELPCRGDRWRRKPDIEAEIIRVEGTVEHLRGKWVATGSVFLRNLTSKKRVTMNLKTFLRLYYPIYRDEDFEDWGGIEETTDVSSKNPAVLST